MLLGYVVVMVLYILCAHISQSNKSELEKDEQMGKFGDSICH